MAELYANNAVTTLAASVGSNTPGATDSITVVSLGTSPWLFPGPSTPGQFRVLVDQEIMLVTGVTSGSGSTYIFAVTRGVENPTTPTVPGHSAGATVTLVLTAASVQNLPAVGTVATGTWQATPIAIAYGGTNSSTALTGNQAIISSGGKIVEGGAMTNGALLVGSSSGPPAPATLAAGTGIAVSNGANSISVALAPFSSLTSSEPALSSVVPGNSGSGNLAFSVTNLLGLLRIAPGHRLTLTSGIPVTTSDVTGASTLYYTPFYHDMIPLWDGSEWLMFQSSGLSLSLSSLTTTVPYDIFVYSSSGTPTLTRTAWSTANTRATALAYINGRLCTSGNATYLYVGTIYPTASTTTEDSSLNRYVFNFYNQVQRKMRFLDNTNFWTCTQTGTYRLANGSMSGAVINCVYGWPTQPIRVRYDQYAITSNDVGLVGIGLNSTSVNSATSFGGVGVSSGSLSTSIVGACSAEYFDYPSSVGLNAFYPLERCIIGNGVDFIGTNPNTGTTNEECPILGWIWA
jgi:hypothetical protein